MAAVAKVHLSFGMITVPVSVYAAARAERVSFKMYDKAHGCTINMPKMSPGQLKADMASLGDKIEHILGNGGSIDEVKALLNKQDFPGKVQGENLVSAIEAGKGEYIPVDQADIKKFDSPKTTKIVLESFMDYASIDPVYFETSYYLVPDEAGLEAYAILAATLAKGNKVGFGKFSLRGKENIVFVRSYQGKMIMHTMFFQEEVGGCDQFDMFTTGVPNPALVNMSLSLLEAMTSAFDPANYENVPQKRLREWVAATIANRSDENVAIPTIVAAKEATDLASMLAASLAAMKAGK